MGSSHSFIDLRKFEIFRTIDGQDGWKIEWRKRMSGKLKGNLYKVFLSPTGGKHYSLKDAKAQGFKGGPELDGRRKRKKFSKSKSHLSLGGA